MPLHSWLPKASFPSFGSSSTIAFKIVRYRLQTFTLVVREALDTGAGSTTPWADSGLGGVMSGRRVDKASGSRRVRNSVDACRYVLEVFDEECRAEVEEESDEMDDESRWFEKRSEAAWLRVAL